MDIMMMALKNPKKFKGRQRRRARTDNDERLCEAIAKRRTDQTGC